MNWKYLMSCIGLVLLFVVSFVCTTTTSEALTGRDVKTIKNYFERIEEYEPPVSIQFNKDYVTKGGKKSPQYRYYGDDVFWEDVHRDEYMWYTIMPKNTLEVKPYDMDFSRLLENHQLEYGPGERAVLNSPYKNNLKLGRVDPKTRTYKGDNTGTTRMYTKSLEGKLYEWRYLGYSANGVPVNNPFFPDDVTGPNDFENATWLTKPWIQTENHAKLADIDDFLNDATRKKNWILKKFFPEYPEFKAKNPDPSYWAERLFIETNPDLSTGIISGFHKRNGTIYYVSFPMQKPALPNMRLTNFEVYNAKNKLIGYVRRDGAHQADTSVDTFKKAAESVVPGQTYTLKATIKNMVQTGLTARQTRTKPVTMDHFYAIDNQIARYNSFEDVFTGANGAKPCDGNANRVIPYGDDVTFCWSYKVPEQTEDQFSFNAKVPFAFRANFDNVYDKDDAASLVFPVAKGDMGIRDLLLTNADGTLAEDVIQGQTYGLQAVIDRPSGYSDVGDPNDINNPYTWVDLSLNDGRNSASTSKVSTDVLKPKSTVTVKWKNALTAGTAKLKGCASLNAIHAMFEQNTVAGNDSRCETWSTPTNIHVGDLKITPSLSTISAREYDVCQPYTLTFKLLYQAGEKKGAKWIPYVVRQGGWPIVTGWSFAYPNQMNHVEVNVPSACYGQGAYTFEVEANPAPRSTIEMKADGSDPYLDNKQRVTANVIRNRIVSYCDVENKGNTWDTIYSYSWWSGESKTRSYYYDHDDDPDTLPIELTQNYCDYYGSGSGSQTVTHYERFEISHVWFKSKQTEHRWVDVKANPSAAKIKAGYGFELKVETQYETNAYSAAPKSWSSGCSGENVNPMSSQAAVTMHTVDIELPIFDSDREPIHINLEKYNSAGSWSNQQVNFELPLRNTVGQNMSRQIFIGKNVSDGVYNLKIMTSSIYGSVDRGSDEPLCDIFNLNLIVKGSAQDDLNTHVIQ